MKVALLTTQSRVSPVFETTTSWLLIEATPAHCKISSTHHFNTQNEIDMSNELLENDIEMVICGALPFYLEKNFINQGCEVFAFIAGEITEVIEALNLNLLDKPQFKMPGCQKRKRRGKNNFCKKVVNQEYSKLNHEGKAKC